MADLLRHTVDTPAPVLQQGTPDIKGNQTARVFGQLAGIGATGVQLYTQEHEKAMVRQAKNDLVNNTINPDLERHEAAYIKTVSDGQALKEFNSLKEDIENKKYDDITPEDFQLMLTEKHREAHRQYKNNRYGSYLSESYDNFWLKNEQTLTAGQAGKYRASLKVKQGQELLRTTAELVDAGSTTEQIIQALNNPNFSMISPDDIIQAALMTGVQDAQQNGRLDVLEQLNEEYNFSVNPKYSKTYNAATTKYWKDKNAVSRATEQVQVDFVYKAAEKGYLTREEKERFLEMRDSEGNYLFSTKELNRLATTAYSKQAESREQSLCNDMIAKNVSVVASGFTKKQAQAALTAYEESLVASGADKKDIAREMGSKTIVQKGVIDQRRKHLFDTFASTDITQIDPKVDNTFSQQYEELLAWYEGTGKDDEVLSYHTTEKARIRFLEIHEAMKYAAGGDYKERLGSAINMTKHRESMVKAGQVPKIDLRNIDTADIDDAADEWSTSKTKGLSRYLHFLAPFDYDDVRQEMNTRTKYYMEKHGLSLPDAIKQAKATMDSNYSYEFGSFQRFGTDQILAQTGGKDSKRVLTNAFQNPDMQIHLDKVFGENLVDHERKDWDKEDYNFTMLEDGTSLLVSKKDDLTKTTTISIPDLTTLSNYDTNEINELVNTEAYYSKDYLATPQGKKKYAENTAANDKFYMHYIVGAVERPELIQSHTDADGNFVEAIPLPTPETWAELPEKDRTDTRLTYNRLHYEGIIGKLKQVSDILNIGTALNQFREGTARLYSGSYYDVMDKNPNAWSDAVTTAKNKVSDALNLPEARQAFAEGEKRLFSGSYRKMKEADEKDNTAAAAADTAGKESSTTFTDTVKQEENAARVGRNKDGIWKPHKSAEGGTDTIGYGHKLTATEAKSGKIVIGGKEIDYKTDGLTDAQIDALFAQDWEEHRKQAAKVWDGFDKLDKRDQDIITELSFNVKRFSKKTWPGLAKAMDMAKGPERDKEISKQISRTYTDRSGKKKPLTKRVNALRKAAGLPEV